MAFRSFSSIPGSILRCRIWDLMGLARSSPPPGSVGSWGSNATWSLLKSSRTYPAIPPGERATMPQPLAKVTLLRGDALAVLRTLPDESVHCVVTSPPYYLLRDYGTPPTVWPGMTYAPIAGLPDLEVPGDSGCEHVWGEALDPIQHHGNPGFAERSGKAPGLRKNEASGQTSISQGQFCTRCGAWRGNLGQEPSIDLYIAHLVAIFREVRRVLRTDGVCWLNIGDSYSQ